MSYFVFYGVCRIGMLLIAHRDPQRYLIQLSLLSILAAWGAWEYAKKLSSRIDAAQIGDLPAIRKSVAGNVLKNFLVISIFLTLVRFFSRSAFSSGWYWELLLSLAAFCMAFAVSWAIYERWVDQKIEERQHTPNNLPNFGP